MSPYTPAQIGLARLALVDGYELGKSPIPLQMQVAIGFCPLCGAAGPCEEAAEERNTKGDEELLREFLESLAALFAQAVREHPELARGGK